MAVFSREVKLLAKRANQRMRALESKGISSPAYRAAQAALEMLGAKGTATGRRFKETGRFANLTQMRSYENIIKNFLGHETSTVRGYNKYRKKVLDAAQQHFGEFGDLGITADEYLEIWEALPDDEAQRMYGSDETVAIVSAVMKQNDDEEDENGYTVSEIIEILQRQDSLKSAMRELGIKPEEVMSDLGDL